LLALILRKKTQPAGENFLGRGADRKLLKSRFEIELQQTGNAERAG
jgi:hypothetical protein